MKKKINYFLMMACAIVFFTSCEDDEVKRSIASAVAGSYSGQMAVTVEGEESQKEETFVTISQDADAQISVVLENLNLKNGTDLYRLGNFKLSGLQLTEEGGVIKVTEKLSKNFSYNHFNISAIKAR